MITTKCFRARVLVQGPAPSHPKRILRNRNMKGPNLLFSPFQFRPTGSQSRSHINSDVCLRGPSIWLAGAWPRTAAGGLREVGGGGSHQRGLARSGADRDDHQLGARRRGKLSARRPRRLGAAFVGREQPHRQTHPPTHAYIAVCVAHRALHQPADNGVRGDHGSRGADTLAYPLLPCADQEPAVAIPGAVHLLCGAGGTGRPLHAVHHPRSRRNAKQNQAAHAGRAGSDQCA